MNWKQIDEIWKTFSANLGLELMKGENNYYRGYVDIYQLRETSNGNLINYENKLDKSCAGYGYGTSLNLTTPLKDISVKLTISRNSFFQRFFLQKSIVKIDATKDITPELPSKRIMKILKEFPDLKVKTQIFGKHNHPAFNFNQFVLKTTTKYQPHALWQLEDLRELHIQILETIQTRH